MGQLARPADAGVERLLPGIVAFQEVMTACGERHGALAALERHRPHQALVSQMTEVRLARIGRLIARIEEIALRTPPEMPQPSRATGCRRR